MSEHQEFNDFVQTIAALRAPGGCPWDRAQTHESIAHNMLEEAYEAVDAIEAGDAAHLREELGDVLLQVVLQSQIAADAGEFDIDDVCRDINDKMVRRHPHVFGGEEAPHAETPDDVDAIWAEVKLSERKAAAAPDAPAADGAASTAAPAQPAGLLDGVPTSFPALMQAQKISRKAVAVGFEWDSLEDVWAKVREEVAEFEAAATPAEREEEFGDILFTLVNVARWADVDAENALRATCRKFRNRWAFMEGAAWASGRSLEDMSQPELEELWQQAKHRSAPAPQPAPAEQPASPEQPAPAPQSAPAPER